MKPFTALIIFAFVSCASSASVSSVHFSKDGANVDYSINHKAAPWEPSTFVSVTRDGPAVIAPVPAPVAIQAAPIVVATPQQVVSHVALPHPHAVHALPHFIPRVPHAVVHTVPHHAVPVSARFVNPFVAAPHHGNLVLV